MPRLNYIDIAKGIGIVLVVLSHTDASSLMYITKGFFVPVFYFCAGHTYSPNGSFLKNVVKREKKIITQYIFFSLLLITISFKLNLSTLAGAFYSRRYLFPYGTPDNVDMLLTGMSPLWFLTSFAVSYFLFYILVFTKQYRMLLISIYILFAGLLVDLPILLPWSVDTAFVFSIIMYAGMYFRHQQINEIAFLPIGLLYIFLMSVAGDINISLSMYGDSFVLNLLLGIMGSLALVYMCKFFEKYLQNGVLSLLGRHSLTIFCMQIPYIVAAKKVFNSLWLGSNNELLIWGRLSENLM